MLTFSEGFYGVAGVTYALPSFWLQLLLVPTVCILIEALFYFMSDEFFPSPVQLGIEEAWLEQQQQQLKEQLELHAANEEDRLEMGALPQGKDAVAASVVPAN